VSLLRNITSGRRFVRVYLWPRFSLISVNTLLLPHIFLGTPSGQFLCPAGSRLQLSRFHPDGLSEPGGKLVNTLLAYKAAARLDLRARLVEKS